MLDLDQLHTNIDALDNGDDASRRKAIRALQNVEQQEWTTAPTAVLRPSSCRSNGSRGRRNQWTRVAS